MDLKQLKEIIKDLPDDMEVGGIGHFGELLQVNDFGVYKGLQMEKEIFYITIEDAGEEPD